MSAAKPKPDEFGRIRARDKDTGHVRSVSELEFAVGGNYEVADGDASSPNGLPVPADTSKPLSSKATPNSGQKAENKEKDNG